VLSRLFSESLKNLEMMWQRVSDLMKRLMEIKSKYLVSLVKEGFLLELE
jgi:hypothetical protein